MTQFQFDPPPSPVARAWLQGAADYIDDASPAKQREWLADFIPIMREAELSDHVTAFDKSLVIITLERWQSEISETQAA